MVNKGNKKRLFLGTATLVLALGLMVFVVEDSKNTREKDKVLTNISKEVKYSTQEGEVKGSNQTMSMPLCSSGVTGYHNGCEACDNTGGWWCGWDPLPDLTYTCGQYCLHRMCGPSACVPDPPSNNAPTAPTSLLTNGQTNPTGITSAPYFSAVFNDPDNGNTGVHYRIQVNTNSSFNGTTMWDSNKTAMTSTAIGARSPNITYNGTALTQNGATYYWRIKFWDNKGAEGAWSATAQFTMNNPPPSNNPPTAPTVLQTNGQTNPTGITSAPYFSAVFNDPDNGNTGVHYRIQVNTNSSFSGTTMWDSNKTAMTSTAIGARSPNITYNGTALTQNGATYYWRIKFWDNIGAEGAWSATAQFTMNSLPTAPTSLLTNGLTNPTDVTTLNPYFSAIYNHPNSAKNAVYYQIHVNTASDFSGTYVWNSSKTAMAAISPGTRSPNITYQGTPLTENGQTYYWAIKFWDVDGKESPWNSANFTMRSGGQPTAPTSLLTNGQTNPTGITSAPYFSAVFNDPDSGNTGVHYQIQVNTNSSFTGTTMWDSNKTPMTATAIGARSPNITYNGTTLPQNGTTYYWRIKFWDNTGLEGLWSSTGQFTMNTPPTSPTSLLTDGKTDPIDAGGTPYFSAIFNDPNSGDTWRYYQIQVNTNSSFTGTTMWDSNKTAMTSTAIGARTPNITYAGSSLNSGGVTYYWRIKLWDNRGSASPWSSTAQFTTATPPTAPSSLRTNGTTNPVNVMPTPAPYFSAIFNHPDSTRKAVHYRIEVSTSSTFSSLFWDSGKTAMTQTNPGARSPNITYGGDTLPTDGTIYYWRIRFWDDLGGQSPVSSNAQFTMNTKPTATALLTEGQTNPRGVTDLTPEFSAIFNDANSGHTGRYYQIQVNTDSAFTGTTMWDSNKTAISAVNSGVRIPDVSYAGTTLTQNGRTYYWRIKFWDNLGADGDWSETASFTMYSLGTVVTCSPGGQQVNHFYIDELQSAVHMGGVYQFTTSITPGSLAGVPRLQSVTLQSTWTVGDGYISAAELRYTSVTGGGTCPTTLPASTSSFGSVQGPFDYSNTVNITGNITFNTGAETCLYLLLTFDYRDITENSVLDFQITDFTGTNITTKIGLPSNIFGTTTFIYPPQFSNISNNGPKDPGSSITFNTTASNSGVNSVKLVLCKTAGISGTSCDGGAADTYCTSSYVSSNPSCSWDIPVPYADGPYYAYPYIFSIDGKPSNSSLQGQAHTFTVANVAPTVTAITINNNDDIDLVVGGTKTVPFTTIVKDNNGCQNNEISTVKGYLYRSGVGYTTCNSSSSSNANNCYPEISCSMVANSCSSSTGAANYTCSTSFEYYTDPTDNVSPFSEESWLATVKATDNGQGTGGANPLTGTLSITGGVNVNSLLAFNITNELNYGPMFPGDVTNTLNKSTTITSGGNIALNHLISGVDMCDDYPACTGVIIPAIQQRYSLDNNTPYHIGSTLSNTPATILTNLAKQTTSTPTESTLWWGIKLPENLPPKEYTGLNTITSVVAN